MRRGLSGRVGVFVGSAILVALGCRSSGSERPPGGAEPTAAETAPLEPTASAAAPRCGGAPIHRDKTLAETVEGSSEACRARLARFVDGKPGDARCSSDADCTIVAAAGGCMGVGMARSAAAEVTPLDRSCAPELSCWDADFSDHRIRCQEGCCSIYEE